MILIWCLLSVSVVSVTTTKISKIINLQGVWVTPFWSFWSVSVCVSLCFFVPGREIKSHRGKVWWKKTAHLAKQGVKWQRNGRSLVIPSKVLQGPEHPHRHLHPPLTAPSPLPGTNLRTKPLQRAFLQCHPTAVPLFCYYFFFWEMKPSIRRKHMADIIWGKENVKPSQPAVLLLYRFPGNVCPWSASGPRPEADKSFFSLSST